MHLEASFWHHPASDTNLVDGIILTRGKRFMEWARIKALRIEGEHCTIYVYGWYECKITDVGVWSLKPHSDRPLHVELTERAAEILAPDYTHYQGYVVEFNISGLGSCLLFPKGALADPKGGTRDYVPDPPKDRRQGFDTNR